MSRYFIQIAFDGSRYHGWQIQKNAHSVQAALNQALKTVFRQEILSLGCGRTDTGVHALDYYAHFDLEKPVPDDKTKDVIYRLNSILPHDIAIKNIQQVSPDASARFDAISRTYQYHIHHKKIPFLADRSFYRRIIPDMNKMNKACSLISGRKDFGCFSKSRTQVKTNICTVFSAGWENRQLAFHDRFSSEKKTHDENYLVFEIKADRFLRNMVRAIVGTLLQVGDGELSLSDFKKVIESKNRSNAGVSVAACGLYLTEIIYPNEIFNQQG